jgi:hypothetical protein
LDLPEGTTKGKKDSGTAYIAFIKQKMIAGNTMKHLQHKKILEEAEKGL